jgi:hypothetical protein
VGFNDPTPAAPVGGNAGITLGQQRLNVFAAAANVWGAQLDSVPTIQVFATMEPLTCTATSAVLGSAGPLFIWANTPGVLVTNTWYHSALANKFAGIDIDANTGDPADSSPEILARFNSELGSPTCLTGSPFYLGLDNNHGTAIDLYTVLLHEFSHGLGFSTVTNTANGAQILGLPSIYDRFMLDNTTGKKWDQMTNTERVASAINPRHVVWSGANVTTAAPQVLVPGTPLLLVSSPASVAGTYDVGAASFGPQLSDVTVTADIMPVVDQPDGTGLACNPLTGANALAVRNNIAMVDRGVCTFNVKVLNAQNAGAKAVIVVDNVAGGPPAGLGGTDPTIVIPSVRITLGDGTAIKSALKFRSRTRSGVIGTLGVDPSRLAGADANGRVLLFTPNPRQAGSSVSHWDTSAFKNLLMEPAINGDLTHNVTPPDDLTRPFFTDIGW